MNPVSLPCLCCHGYSFITMYSINSDQYFRHEKPTDPDDPLSDQNIRDRFYGNKDPVATKLLERYSAMPKITPPEDKSITTLYIGNIGDDITEKDIRLACLTVM